MYIYRTTYYHVVGTELSQKIESNTILVYCIH